VRIRPLEAGDARAAGELLLVDVANTPYVELPIESLRSAMSGPNTEVRGLVAERAWELIGVALFGLVAGAVGAGRLHAVAVTASARLQGVATRLVDEAVRALRADGARFVLVEMPDDRRLRAGLTLLLRGGFREEARVPDFYRDGVDLLLLRREVD
jgi:ribosomal protein S18 acetylase RimI-like enzyme